MPESCSITLGGETESTDYMVNEMVQWMALALPCGLVPWEFPV